MRNYVTWDFNSETKVRFGTLCFVFHIIYVKGFMSAALIKYNANSPRNISTEVVTFPSCKMLVIIAAKFRIKHFILSTCKKKTQGHYHCALYDQVKQQQ